MDTTANSKEQKTTPDSLSKIAVFLGDLFAFNNSLKLYHWHVTGKGSYAEHIALDQALDSVGDILDRLVETSYSVYGQLEISIPETDRPQDIASYARKFYDYIQKQRDMFKESFLDSIIDDYQEAIQQLLYRLRRLE